MNFVDVIVPVYRGLEETRECILSAVNSIDAEVGQLIVINDCSPEPELVDWLSQASVEFGFTLLHNPENLGFVATVNRGMKLNLDNDVLLLNSDVEVCGDWLTRMRDGAYSQDKIASVTPFSNNATICSFPKFCEDNDLPFGLSVSELDNIFSDCFTSRELVEVPTGVGFCMYIRRICLDDVGYFDQETFGKGYGEENDWCQRAEKNGWVNYHQLNVFAYHKGGVSFSDEQDPRKAKALELISKIHPEYDQQVQKFIQRDPAKQYRVQALWRLFACARIPKVVHISHRLGGGVQEHIFELSKTFEHQVGNLQIMPLVDGKSVTLSILDRGQRLSGSITFDVESEYDRLVHLLTSLGVSRVQIHHTMGLHPKLWRLPADLDCEYYLTVHDYYWVNGSPTLIDADVAFAGDLPFEQLAKKCSEVYPIPVPSEVWRSNHMRLISNAAKVIFPSQDTCNRFTKYMSVEESRRVVSWHPDSLTTSDYPVPTFEIAKNRTLKVLVVGAISREKGADVLEAVAKRCESCEFHLLGYAYRKLDSSVITHGPYRADDAIDLIESIAPDVVWYPAQWPETYSYTLSLAFKSGLPVVVPNLGAFPERVKGRHQSAVVNWNASVNELVQFWSDLVRTGMFSKCNVPNDQLSLKIDQSFYRVGYFAKLTLRESAPDEVNTETLTLRSSDALESLSGGDIALKYIWRVSRLPLISGVVKIIPYNIKRSVKRFFSSKPVHEILSS